MKRILLLLLLAGSLTARASVSIDFQAGDLTTAGGAAPVPVGSLLLLIAAGPNGTFSNSLTAGQYVASDDVVLASFSLNNNGSGNATLNALTNLNVSGLVGEALEIRWFPSTGSPSTFTEYTDSTPTVAGESYGDYAGPTTGTPNGGNPWVVPADGASVSLNFITQSLNTSQGSPLSDAEPNVDGYANSQVAAPEPSTYGLLLLGLCVVFGASRRKNLFTASSRA